MDLPMTWLLVLNFREDKAHVAASMVPPYLKGEISMKAKRLSASLCIRPPIMLPPPWSFRLGPMAIVCGG